MIWIAAGIQMSPDVGQRRSRGVEIKLNTMLGLSYQNDASVQVYANGNPGSIPKGSEALFTPLDAAVLTVEELTVKMRDSDAALNQELRTPHPSEAVILCTKSVHTTAVVEALRFFASHAWTGTHPGQDFGRKMPSAYCVVRVHNAAISASGRDGLYRTAGPVQQ